MNSPVFAVLGAVAVIAGLTALAIKQQPATPGSQSSSRRDKFLEVVRASLGIPYQWGGGHGGRSWGLDCSGLVLVAAKEAQIKIEGWTADTMWKSMEKVPLEKARPGDLVFYGPSHFAQHVVVIVDTASTDPMRWNTIGANGGDSSTLTPERAEEQHAFVREAPLGTVRKDLLGARRLPA